MACRGPCRDKARTLGLQAYQTCPVALGTASEGVPCRSSRSTREVHAAGPCHLCSCPCICRRHRGPLLATQAEVPARLPEARRVELMRVAAQTATIRLDSLSALRRAVHSPQIGVYTPQTGDMVYWWRTPARFSKVLARAEAFCNSRLIRINKYLS